MLGDRDSELVADLSAEEHVRVPVLGNLEGIRIARLRDAGEVEYAVLRETELVAYTRLHGGCDAACKPGGWRLAKQDLIVLSDLDAEGAVAFA